MMQSRHIQWLYDELPNLVVGGVITEENATRLREHYGPIKPHSATKLALTLFSILGGLLIGSGVILLLAYNWTDLGRPVRAVLSFLPLVAGQALVGWTLLRKGKSAPWREGSSSFLAMGIGASIALVGQTYHIPGNLANFLMVWLLLGVPLIYLCGSTVVAMLYLVGTAVWAIASQDVHNQALWYWPLLCCVLPHIWVQLQRHREQPRTGMLLWALCLSLCLGLGVAIERVLPGLWIIIYSCLFALFCLAGRTWCRNVPGKPLTIVGSTGTVILALVLTFDDCWRRIGYSHYRGGRSQYMEWFGIQDYVLVVGLLAVVVVLAVRMASRKEFAALAWAASPLVAVVGYAIASMEGAEDIPAFLYNLFLFGLGLQILTSGIREGRLGIANGGMGVLALLFTVRFFDSDMGILVRGVAFIIIGAGFLGANLWLSRRLSADATEVKS